MLEKIHSPEDLRKLPLEALPGLSSEIRKRIIDVVSVTGGHIASSLGAVELAMALHYCFNTPKDKIIWDVGHQAYAHKIITGRNDCFETLRKSEGISGFPHKDESEYDPFTVGHSSNAVSLALGLVCAYQRLGAENNPKIVAVIGDGSLSGGLCFEGLNNAGHLKKDILVILNTNELSIAPNAGALSTYINKVLSLPIYNRFRGSLEGFVSSRIPKGSRLIKIANKFEEGLKGLFIPGIFFEELGFRYFGPLDGHNLDLLIPTLKNIMNLKGPRLLHIITKKGKGYPPAEKEPVKFHSTGPFNISNGDPVDKNKTKSYTEVFSEKIVGLASQDKRIVAITAAMAEGTGLDKFRDLYPDRFFDVGIAEQHAVCFAAGLARAGLKPVAAIYSTFLQRAYDQLIEDVALQDLPVVLAIDRAGIVGEDGPTHQGVFDIAYLRSIPNFTIMAPMDAKELESMLSFAMTLGKPVAIRYPKGTIEELDSKRCNKIELGKAEILSDGDDFAIIAVGTMASTCYKVIEILKKEGLHGSLVNARFIRPIDTDVIQKVCSKAKRIITVEEGVLDCGFGAAVVEATGLAVTRIGLPFEFIPAGKRKTLLEKYGLSESGIANTIRGLMGR
ncbi:MAG: 1-deoxy-D-xylulose-5-phosphate synthase [Candidatus Omnitrophota bacterium]|jgi:1-deoxy-D-xylulose-5-phosphate synthase|nr:MAG: 1-deoxy-D-xylulose-5-phosphate synthase [Candidatus Omnitrophota bacterium]